MTDLVIQMVSVAEQDDFSCGICARFLRINERWGVKLYRTVVERDNNYDRQEYAYNNDIAPKLGERVDVEWKGILYYGFITEAVEMTYKDIYKKEIDEKIVDKFCPDFYWKDKDIRILMERARTLGICTGDMHWANVGWLPDGRLMMIDFSEDIYDQWKEMDQAA